MTHVVLNQQQLEVCGDCTQPPKEAVCAKVINRKIEDVYLNETFQEEVSQDTITSVLSLIDQPPTLLGMIEELHLKWSRRLVPGGKEQE